jgi:hypothetical protein
VLVTAAHRGLGRALVGEAISREVARVFAGTLQALARPDPWVAPIPLHATDEMLARAAAGPLESLDMLINNPGIAIDDDLTDRALLEHHLRSTCSAYRGRCRRSSRRGGALAERSSTSCRSPRWRPTEHPAVLDFENRELVDVAIPPRDAGPAWRGRPRRVAGPIETGASGDLAVA